MEPEIVRYNSEELEVVLERMMELEERIEKASVLTNTIVSVDTEIRYYIDDNNWEGVIIVNNDKSRK